MKKKKVNNNGDMYFLEKSLWEKGYKYIAGTDEVGRGPMAGPVCVAAVILDRNNLIDDLNDSKKLTYKQRESLFNIIKEKALYYKICFIDNKEVDKINVLEASRKGMEECINGLEKADYALTDCMDLYNINIPYDAYIKGDSTSASIAAASIIAKVARDHYMEDIAVKYPGYGFEKHKGYVTKAHKEALERLGPCKIHRFSYAPVIDAIKNKK